MGVFLTYHTLEERDARHISLGWSWFIIVLLLVATFCSYGVSYSVFCLEYDFQMNCFLYAKLVLPPKLDHCQPTSLNFMSYSVAFTKWGPRSACDYAILMPLIQGSTGVICIAVFIIFGRGGASPSGLIPQPWCIVLPTTIYFGAMLAFSIFFVQFMHRGLETVCNQLTAQYPECSCFDLLNIFEKEEFNFNRTIDSSWYSIMMPSENYILIYVYMYVATVAYMVMIFIMIVRCLCVTDFKLVRVTIASYEGDSIFREPSTLKLHRASRSKRPAFLKEAQAAVDMELGRIIEDVLSKINFPVELELTLDVESVSDTSKKE